MAGVYNWIHDSFRGEEPKDGDEAGVDDEDMAPPEEADDKQPSDKQVTSPTCSCRHRLFQRFNMLLLHFSFLLVAR